MKKVVLVTAIVLVGLSLILFFLTNQSNENSSHISNNSKEKIQISEFYIEDRVILKKNGDIYVGNNTKELENNFYDIKIANTKEGIIVFLNKLWYETYGEDYIQDEYLAKICRELSSRLNVESNTEQFEYVLYKYIKDNYTKVRNNEQIEELFTDMVNLKFELQDNIVKLIIS